MPRTLINTDSLAHHLDVCAQRYDQDASTAAEAVKDGGRLARTFEQQAAQCRQWADALRNVRSLGFGPADEIELLHD